MKFLFFFLITLCVISCTKKVEPVPNENKIDTISIQLDRLKNSVDSFTVNITGDWTITADTSTWVELSATSGSGATLIYVKALQANNFPTERLAKFIINNTEDASEKTEVNLTQKKYIFSPWSKLYGGSQWDYFNSITPTPDGGYIAVAYTNSNDGDITTNNGEQDLWIVKIDAAGEIEWEKSYGGSLGDAGQQIIRTSGGYVILGYTGWSVGSATTHWIFKIDETGDIVWEKTFEGIDILHMAAIPSGGFICSGIKSNDAFLLRLDEAGNTNWMKTYGGNLVDRASGVDVDTDGNFIAIGNTDYPEVGTVADFDAQDIWIFKVDKDGNLLWEKKQGGAKLEWARKVMTTDDGGAMIYSSTQSTDFPGYHGNYDILITKINETGDLEWHKVFGTSDNEYCNSLIKSDGGYIFTAQVDEVVDGDKLETLGLIDAWVVKIDNSGNILYNKVFGGSGVDIFSEMVIANNKLVFAGQSTSTEGDFVSNHGSIEGWIKAIDLP